MTLPPVSEHNQKKREIKSRLRSYGQAAWSKNQRHLIFLFLQPPRFIFFRSVILLLQALGQTGMSHTIQDKVSTSWWYSKQPQIDHTDYVRLFSSENDYALVLKFTVKLFVCHVVCFDLHGQSCMNNSLWRGTIHTNDFADLLSNTSSSRLWITNERIGWDEVFIMKVIQCTAMAK